MSQSRYGTVKLDALESKPFDLTVVEAEPLGVPDGTFTQISV
jgi:hypothetical protein